MVDDRYSVHIAPGWLGSDKHKMIPKPKRTSPNFAASAKQVSVQISISRNKLRKCCGNSFTLSTWHLSTNDDGKMVSSQSNMITASLLLLMLLDDGGCGGVDDNGEDWEENIVVADWFRGGSVGRQIIVDLWNNEMLPSRVNFSWWVVFTIDQ